MNKLNIIGACWILFATLFAVPTAAQSARLLSATTSDEAGGILSYSTGVSLNGRFVVFASFATNLTNLPDNPGTQDIFVRDLMTGTTKLVSVNAAGAAAGNGDSFSPRISADGRFVVFSSVAADLVANDNNGNITDVFLRDLQEGTTSLVSVKSNGTGGGNANSFSATMTPDGRYVAFVSLANDLTPNDTGSFSDVFVRDMQSGVTTMASVNRAGTTGGDRPSGVYDPDTNTHFSLTISDDGRFVAFLSFATDLTDVPDTNNSPDAFVRDRTAGTTIMVSVNRDGTASGTGNFVTPFGRAAASSVVLSPDGMIVAFTSAARDLVAGDTNETLDVFVRDLRTNTTALVSVNRDGTGSGNNFSFRALSASAISADNRFIVFRSQASNLVANDTNGVFHSDVFIRDLATQTTSLVTVNAAGTESAKGEVGSALAHPVISRNGRFVAFASRATDLITSSQQSGFTDNVFVRDLKTGVTAQASVGVDGALSTGNSFQASLSADGRTLAFESRANNLVPNDMNTLDDAFVYVVPPVYAFTSDARITEGTGATIAAAIRVQLSDPSTASVTISYTTSAETATGDRDFQPTSGVVTFAPGETEQIISVPIITDALDEPDETFAVTLSDAAGAGLFRPRGTITILDDDLPPSISINDVTVTEGDAGTIAAVFHVTLSAASGRTVTINYATANETANAFEGDFQQVSGTLTFAPEQTALTVSVPVRGDTLYEGAETFAILITNPMNATLGDDRGVGTILNDDPAPILNIGDVSVTEGYGDNTFARFTISLSATSALPTTVNVATTDGTATAGADYQTVAGELTIPRGARSRIVSVLIKRDKLAEPDEIFFVDLSLPTNATLGDARAQGTIANAPYTGRAFGRRARRR